MADQHKTDIFMRFTTMDTGDVDCECAANKSPSDPFMSDYKPQTYQDFSNFFEVSKFDFGFEVQDRDSGKNKVADTKSVNQSTAKVPVGRVLGEFASWRSATEAQAPNVIFPIEFQPFKFERIIDSASPIFFFHCCYSISFKSASLVKRVARDADSPAEAFLRIDFFRPMITGLSWDDGDMTTEKGEFVCRHFKLQYRQQNFDGSFSSGTATAEWDSKDDALPKNSSPTGG